jgi:hypothetical protein
MTPLRSIFVLIAVCSTAVVAVAQEQPLSPLVLRSRLRQALDSGDVEKIREAAAAGAEALGDAAGLPEVPDEYQAAPADVPPLTARETAAGFQRLLEFVRHKKWWRIGLDPTKTEHLPREAAACIVALTAGVRAGAADQDAMLAEAREAADYLLWTQEQSGRGLFPFPYFRGGGNKAFQAADRFIAAAERAGRLHEFVRDGWMIDDADDGGLQFDNGLCGAALLELYEVCGDERYRKSAGAAADWAVGRPLATNWNYNSFSVYLLAEAYRITGEKKYLASAVAKAIRGVVPGQLTAGPRVGRWADSHNARPAYHYIMIRGLAALLNVLPMDDPAWRPIVDSTRLALVTRNREFTAQGIMNVDSALEALLLYERVRPDVREAVGDCESKAALEVLRRHVTAELRRGRGPAGPGQVGRFLENADSRGS